MILRGTMGAISAVYVDAYAVAGTSPDLVAGFEAEYYRTNGAPTTFASMFNFSRASTATYVDGTGTLQTAASGEARIGHHVWDGSQWVNEGVLIESEARTNLLTYSEDFTDVVWSKAAQNSASTPVVTANQATDPSGGFSADLVVFETTGTSSDDRSRLYHTFSETVTGTYTFSVWLKSTSSTAHTLKLVLANAVITTVVVTDEWQRFNISVSRSNQLLNLAEVRLSGDLDATASIYIWGAQLE